MEASLLLAAVLVVWMAASADKPKAGPARAKAVDKALETFAGTWAITAAEPEGITQNAQTLVFRKDMTYAALDKDNKELWAGTFDLDPTASPKVFDHRSHDAEKTGGDALGIYELNGDSLKFSCVVGTWTDKQWTGKPRPTEFKVPNAEVVLELRRASVDK